MASRKKRSKSFNSLARKRAPISFGPPVYESDDPDSGYPDSGYLDTDDDEQPDVFDPVNLVLGTSYYQGPSASTRVAGFQFVPEHSEYMSMAQFREALASNDAIMGYLYVWWVKGSNISKYGPMSLSEYEDFKNSNSFGQAILSLPGYEFDVGQVGG